MTQSEHIVSPKLDDKDGKICFSSNHSVLISWLSLYFLIDELAS